MKKIFGIGLVIILLFIIPFTSNATERVQLNLINTDKAGNKIDNNIFNGYEESYHSINIINSGQTNATGQFLVLRVSKEYVSAIDIGNAQTISEILDISTDDTFIFKIVLSDLQGGVSVGYPFTLKVKGGYTPEEEDIVIKVKYQNNQGANEESEIRRKTEYNVEYGPTLMKLVSKTNPIQTGGHAGTVFAGFESSVTPGKFDKVAYMNLLSEIVKSSRNGRLVDKWIIKINKVEGAILPPIGDFEETSDGNYLAIVSDMQKAGLYLGFPGADINSSVKLIGTIQAQYVNQKDFENPPMDNFEFSYDLTSDEAGFKRIVPYDLSKNINEIILDKNSDDYFVHSSNIDLRIFANKVKVESRFFMDGNVPIYHWRYEHGNPNFKDEYKVYQTINGEENLATPKGIRYIFAKDNNEIILKSDDTNMREYGSIYMKPDFNRINEIEIGKTYYNNFVTEIKIPTEDPNVFITKTFEAKQWLRFKQKDPIVIRLSVMDKPKESLHYNQSYKVYLQLGTISGNWRENPKFKNLYFLFPRGMEIDLDKTKASYIKNSDMNGQEGSFEVVRNFNNTGKNMLIIKDPHLSNKGFFNKYYDIFFIPKKELEVGEHTLEVFAQVDPEAMEREEARYNDYNTKANIYDLNQNGNLDEELLFTSFNIVFNPPKEVVATSEIKTEGSEQSFSDYYDDDSKEYSFQFKVNNYTDQTVGKVKAINVLPRIGDYRLVGVEGNLPQRRGSTTNLFLKNPITIIKDDAVTIEYTTTPYDFQNQEEVSAFEQRAEWTTITPEFNSVTAIRITKPDGLKPDESLSFSMSVDFDPDAKDKDIAVNSFAFNLNDNEYIESRNSTVTLIKYEIKGEFFIDENNDGIKNNDEESLEGVPVILYKKSGDEWIETQSSSTDGSGNYVFYTNLSSGIYQVQMNYSDKYTATKIVDLKNDPGGSSLDADKKSASVNLNTTNSQVVINGGARNKTASIRINKQDDYGRNLAGAKFQLSTNNTVLGEYESDHEGVLLINNLNLGEYVIVEIEAPESYKKDENERTLLLESEGEIKEIRIENELKINDPKKTIVKDLEQLTEEEKAKVKEEVKKANPKLPKDLAISVDDKGNVSIVKDTNEKSIPKEKTVILSWTPINEAPKLEVKDETIYQGEELDLKTLIVSASDKEDGEDLKDQVEITGSFNKDVLGEYEIFFKLTDSQGASVSKIAIVTVKVKEGIKKPIFKFPTTKVDSRPIDIVNLMPEDVHIAYIFGYPEGTVKPDGNLTRAEAAAMLARLKNLDLTYNKTPNFIDTKSKNAWYNPIINAVVKINIMRGYPDRSFKPDNNITRAEFTKMIMPIDIENESIGPFVDIKGHWAEEAINQAYGNNRIDGYPDGKFRPNGEITRAEAIKILNRLFKRKVTEIGFKMVENPKMAIPFIDLDSKHWAYYELVEATNNHTFYRLAHGQDDEGWVRIFKK